MTIWTELLGLEFCVRMVDAGGVATRSLQAGSGEDVIFLHGTSGHLEAFARNIAAYARHYRCHAIDMLGHGFSGKPRQRYEIPRYVEHILAYMEACKIQRAHLVGQSLGGWVAAWLASDHPDRVISLQLFSTGGIKASPEIMERIRTSVRAAVHCTDSTEARKSLQHLIADPNDVTDELVETRYHIYRAPEFLSNVENLLALQDMETRQRNMLFPERLRRIAAPTLIVWGRENPFGDASEAYRLHAMIHGSRLELLDECGHWPQHEQPERYNKLALSFLGSLSKESCAP